MNNIGSVLSGLPKFVLPLLVLLIAGISANAQSPTPNEQACYDMVQGKVAYDRAGNRNWSPGNVWRLCKGTANPTATIDCFSQRVTNYNDWERGLRECAAGVITTSTGGGKVVRDTSGQAPPDSTYCADDFQTCAFQGQREVIYGANGVFTRKTLTGNFVCQPSAFGIADPLPGVLKKCYLGPASTPAQQPASPAMVTRNIAIKNSSTERLAAILVDRSSYADLNTDGTFKYGLSQIGPIREGETRSLGINAKVAVGDDVELHIMHDSTHETYFKALMPKVANLTNFCFEVTGTNYLFYVRPCSGSAIYEQKYILMRVESGYNARMDLTYYPIGASAARTMTTPGVPLGFQRKIYLPLDADTSRQMVLKVKIDVTGTAYLTRNVTERDFDSVGTTCYKTWGAIASPKVSQCSLDVNARTVKFWNNAGYPAKLVVTYYDKGSDGKDVATEVSSNVIEVTQTETFAVPMGTSTTPARVTAVSSWVDGGRKKIFDTPVRANFTGELCYKVEGTAFAPTGSTCGDTVGDTTSANTRQIRFQNDSGFDAAMIITYFVDEVIGGQKIAMPKTLTTGMINGLGKTRIVTMPLKTSASMPITISLQGNATLKNNIWSTTLPANFPASPQQCFKVWGTLFDPQGGKCDQ